MTSQHSRRTNGPNLVLQGFVLLLLVSLVGLFLSGKLVFQGVPSSIIVQFLQDDVARNAYIVGDRKRLHDRLSELGVEEKIKAYYQSDTLDAAELDQHIHQILYDRTGYVGEAYTLSATGTLVPKQNPIDGEQ